MIKRDRLTALFFTTGLTATSLSFAEEFVQDTALLGTVRDKSTLHLLVFLQCPVMSLKSPDIRACLKREASGFPEDSNQNIDPHLTDTLLRMAGVYHLVN